MTALLLLLVGLLLAILSVFSYIDRLYGEMGKFLSRGFQNSIDFWEEQTEPRLGFSREKIALSAAVLAQMALAGVTLLAALLVLGPKRDGAEIAEVLFAAALAVVLFNRFLPYVLFTRTAGRWLLPLVWPLRALIALLLPITLVIGFLLSIVALAGEPADEQEDEAAGAGVDKLIEAGQEEGILEADDHALVRSAVEFGDKVVREVMTPRPRIFAMPETATVEQLIAALAGNPHSRVPVFDGSLDQITGMVFTHDVLRISDAEAAARTVGSIAREAVFIPETKRANEALRDMQREKQQMNIVIDEYGGVAGIVTIEDLVEAIVGAIADGHKDEDKDAVLDEGDGVWSVPGELEVGQLKNLLNGDWEAPEDYEATTVAGLVSETAGRIPMPGEVVEETGLRFEILSSTDRRIERMRVSRAGAAA